MVSQVCLNGPRFAGVIKEMEDGYVVDCVKQLQKGKSVDLSYSTGQIEWSIEELTEPSQLLLRREMETTDWVSLEYNGMSIAQKVREAWKTISEGEPLYERNLIDETAEKEGTSPVGISFQVRDNFLADSYFSSVIEEVQSIYVRRCIQQLYRGEPVYLYYKTEEQLRCPVGELTEQSQNLLKDRLTEVYYRVSVVYDGISVVQQVREAFKASSSVRETELRANGNGLGDAPPVGIAFRMDPENQPQKTD